ncbi:MAG: LysM peptidoglycan-binding domain-containing protein [Candidatus Merdivicinus sp.]|jgi:nucleoid-associated protein YgaU
MRIFLGDLEFPVAPAKIEIGQESGWKSIYLEETGQVLSFTPPALQKIRFEGLFPALPYAFVTAQQLRSPAEHVLAIQKMQADSSPVRLVISGGACPFSLQVVIDSFQRWEQAGEEGDVYFQISLCEYRPYGNKILTPAIETALPISSPDRSGSPEIPQSYTVQEGDCLWLIAARFLGDGSRYREIADLNEISNANLIYPGQILRIPH